MVAEHERQVAVGVEDVFDPPKPFSVPGVDVVAIRVGLLRPTGQIVRPPRFRGRATSDCSVPPIPARGKPPPRARRTSPHKRGGTLHSLLIYCRPKTGTRVHVGGWRDERRRRIKPLNGSTTKPDFPEQHRMRAHLGAVL